jgi:hypothetical protein
LSYFVWLHAVRTAALRATVSNALLRLTFSLEEFLRSAEGEARVKEHMHENLEPMLEKELKRRFPKLSGPQINQLIIYTRSEEIREQLRVHLDSRDTMASTQELMGRFFRHLKSSKETSRMLSRGHNSATSKLVAKRVAPTRLREADWTLERISDGALLIGDCCVFCVDQSGSLCSVMRGGLDWRAMYMPISKSSVVVARIFPDDPLLTREQINFASASCSNRTFYSAVLDEEVLYLKGVIGTNSAAISDAELSKISSDHSKSA